MEKVISRKSLMLPMRFAQTYLWLTLAIFLTSEFTSRIENLSFLVGYLSSAFALFYFGYWLAVRTTSRSVLVFGDPSSNDLRFGRVVVAVGATYFLLWAANQIYDFGGRTLADVLSAIQDPGQAYKAKFEVYERREALGEVNRLTQALIFVSFLSAIFIQTLVYFWASLSRGLRVYAVLAILLYVSSFLFIGTQKGIGDVLLYMIAGVAVVVVSGRTGLSAARLRRFSVASIALVVLAFGYMVSNQMSRADAFGIQESFMFGDVSSTIVADFFGNDVAYGFYTTIGYPSHGYGGLAYNLKQDFVFSNGAGLSQAYESYRLQYIGGESNFLLTYPARTEASTGWPAGMYWSTIFPWLASDLTFPGAAALMFLLGYGWARTWMSCLRRYEIVSVALFGQLVIFVAFIPANNQVLMSRQGLWTILAALFVWGGRRLLRRRL